MILINSVVFMILFVIYKSHSLNNKGVECQQMGSCICAYPQGVEINLNNISSYISSTGNNSFIYFYAPCQAFAANKSEPDKKSALWLFNANETIATLDPAKILNGEVNGTFTALACGDTAQFVRTGFELNQAAIEYVINNTKSQITLDCVDGGKTSLTFDLEPLVALTHNLLLRGDIACPKMKVDPTQGQLSTGSVLVITLFSFIIVYLVGGMLMLKYLRGAQGLEMIPNIEFWRDLPALVRDGFVFAVSCGRGIDTYERI